MSAKARISSYVESPPATADVATPELHIRATRLLHAGLAVSVIVQLGSSLLMVPPLDNHAENVFFEIHEYAGLAALALAAVFWVTVLMRRRGTPVSKMLPWFSAVDRSSLWRDVGKHWQTLRGLRLPAYESGAPLASAVHGLGLLLILAMTATGGLFYLALLLGTKEAAWVGLDLEVHTLLATLVWAYLIGHAGIALLYRFVGQLDLDRMWSFGKDKSSTSVD